MPTYKNTSNSVVSTHGMSWAPGESKRVAFSITHPRLTQTDSGLQSPVVVGESVSLGSGEDKEYKLLENASVNYRVSVVCLAGSAEVRMNSKTAIPAPLPKAGASFDGEYPSQVLSKLIVTGASPDTIVSVYVETTTYSSF